MKKRVIPLVVLVIAAVFQSFSGLQAGNSTDFKIIVHPANPISSLTKKQVSDFLLKKSSKWDDGRKVLPVDLAASSEVRTVFSLAVHRKKVSTIKSYWAQSVFSGLKSAPPEMKSEAEVVAYVKARPGAIGYVSGTTRTDSVRVLNIRD